MTAARRRRRGGAAAAAAAAVLTAALLAAGCTTRLSDLPGVYRPDIRQGNAFEEAKLARLETGMARDEVLRLLGAPAIDDTFHPDRWDYLYTFAPGGRGETRRRIALHFEDGRLARFEGDLEAPDAAPAPAAPAARVVRVPPRPPEKGFFARLFGSDDDE